MATLACFDDFNVMQQNADVDADMHEIYNFLDATHENDVVPDAHGLPAYQASPCLPNSATQLEALQQLLKVKHEQFGLSATFSQAAALPCGAAGSFSSPTGPSHLKMDAGTIASPFTPYSSFARPVDARSSVPLHPVLCAAVAAAGELQHPGVQAAPAAQPSHPCYAQLRPHELSQCLPASDSCPLPPADDNRVAAAPAPAPCGSSPLCSTHHQRDTAAPVLAGAEDADYEEEDADDAAAPARAPSDSAASDAAMCDAAGAASAAAAVSGGSAGSASHRAASAAARLAPPPARSAGHGRSGGGGGGKRAPMSHSTIEKHRRDRINTLIEELGELVPPQDPRFKETGSDASAMKRPKHAILADVVTSYRELQSENDSLRQQLAAATAAATAAGAPANDTVRTAGQKKQRVRGPQAMDDAGACQQTARLPTQPQPQPAATPVSPATPSASPAAKLAVAPSASVPSLPLAAAGLPKLSLPQGAATLAHGALLKAAAVAAAAAASAAAAVAGSSPAQPSDPTPPPAAAAAAALANSWAPSPFAAAHGGSARESATSVGASWAEGSLYCPPPLPPAAYALPTLPASPLGVAPCSAEVAAPRTFYEEVMSEYAAPTAHSPVAAAPPADVAGGAVADAAAAAAAPSWLVRVMCPARPDLLAALRGALAEAGCVLRNAGARAAPGGRVALELEVSCEGGRVARDVQVAHIQAAIHAALQEPSVPMQPGGLAGAGAGAGAGAEAGAGKGATAAAGAAAAGGNRPGAAAAAPASARSGQGRKRARV